MNTSRKISEVRRVDAVSTRCMFRPFRRIRRASFETEGVLAREISCVTGSEGESSDSRCVNAGWSEWTELAI